MDNKAKIANCKICTLAAVMKDCKNCPFNIGLTVQKIEAEKARIENLNQSLSKIEKM